jgi:hypothetical protein
MTFDRRALLMAAGGASAALLGAGKSLAAETGEPSVAPLIAAGLDPFKVYRQMYAGTGPHSSCCWWFAGSLPFHVDEVGLVEAFQEETLRAHRIEDQGPDKFTIHWREAGVFRDFLTGEVPKTYFDPVTGKEAPHESILGHDAPPAAYVVSRAGQGVKVDLLLPGATVHSVTINGEVHGDRVSLTQVETKSREMLGKTSNLRVTLKVYASLAALKSGAPSVPAKGFYSVYLPDFKSVFVAGMMQKATLGEALNPIAWKRVRETSPAFFTGNEVAVDWK